MTAPTDPLTRARALLACAGDPGVYSTVPVSIDTLAALCDELEKARALRDEAWHAATCTRGRDGVPFTPCDECAGCRLRSALARYDAARRGEAG